MPQFDELPFNARPDLTPYLIHLTKNTRRKDEYSALENLMNILREGEIWGSEGFIKGRHRATCFMDVPFQALKYVLTPENRDPKEPRYEPYGLLVTKKLAYKKGCRPVLYLSDGERKTIGIPDDELWRVVKLEVTGKKWISWVHEREWRCKGSFKLPSSILAVLVETTRDAAKLAKWVASEADCKCKPRSIIPLNVVSQGLLRPS